MMNKGEAEKVVKDTIEYANQEIKKIKTRYLKKFLITFGIVMLLITTYLLIFKYEIPVKYSNSIVEVNIPEDKGIDIKIGLDNYKSANAILVKIDENTYDLYINITQTISTKIFKDNDKSNNMLRVGNNMVVDFQTEKLRGYIPNGNDDESIKHIYYIDNLSNKTLLMSDSELLNYKNKTLIWEKINKKIICTNYNFVN